MFVIKLLLILRALAVSSGGDVDDSCSTTTKAKLKTVACQWGDDAKLSTDDRLGEAHCSKLEKTDTLGGSDSTETIDAASILIKNLHASISSAERKLISNTKYKTYDAVDNEVFDFIVVGAGAAGAVVANRLSENTKWKVLLLEAGGEPSITTEIPGLFGTLLRSKESWNYFSEPGDSNCLGMNDGKCAFPRGKVLGGSTAINAMYYLRGDSKDYDAWAEVGNTGWDYESVLPYFKKSEHMRASEIINAPDFSKHHNKDGYLKVDNYYSGKLPKTHSTFYNYISNAFKELGLDTYTDVNNGNINPGFHQLQTTNDYGTRCSSAKAFIKPVQDRPNLFTSINSLATKLLINDKTVYGVEFLNKHGKRIKVKANLEVIVSGGSINSPQLLMLSGIGPEDHLEELDIKVVQNLNVGVNLQDHLLVKGLLLKINYSLGEQTFTDSMQRYLSTFTGDLSTTALGFCGFIDTTSRNYPDIQYHLHRIEQNNVQYVDTTVSGFNINDTYADAFYSAVSDSNLLDIYMNLLDPSSRGKVLLRSTDPLDPPKIYLNLLKTSSDLKKTIAGIRFVQTLCETKSMTEIGCSLVRMDVPRCSSYIYDSDDYWECYLKSLSSTIHHPVGTCKMGPASDTSAVVNPQLKVRGVKNLRVVDASIMPKIVRSNTMAATYMIAEKASDMIKDYWCPNGIESCL